MVSLRKRERSRNTWKDVGRQTDGSCRYDVIGSESGCTDSNSRRLEGGRGSASVDGSDEERALNNEASSVCS